MERPRVAVTVGVLRSQWDPVDDRGRYLPYAQAVNDSGGEPIFVGPERSREILTDPSRFLRGFAGLLLTGGGDIHPALYPHPPALPHGGWDRLMEEQHMRVDPGRDPMELALAQVAVAEEVPVLGICRGFQVLNVALGGQLVLDLDPELGHSRRPDGSSSHHSVEVLPGTRLREILEGANRLEVNSRHHQGVDDAGLAPGLLPSAIANPRRVIEGIEVPGHPWALGIQWHPERAEDALSHQGSWPIFLAFVASCRKRAQ